MNEENGFRQTLQRLRGIPEPLAQEPETLRRM